MNTNTNTNTTAVAAAAAFILFADDEHVGTWPTYAQAIIRARAVKTKKVKLVQSKTNKVNLVQSNDRDDLVYLRVGEDVLFNADVVDGVDVSADGAVAVSLTVSNAGTESDGSSDYEQSIALEPVHVKMILDLVNRQAEYTGKHAVTTNTVAAVAAAALESKYQRVFGVDALDDILADMAGI